MFLRQRLYRKRFFCFVFNLCPLIIIEENNYSLLSNMLKVIVRYHFYLVVDAAFKATIY